MKAVINGVLSIKDIVLVVHVTLVKPSAMQKLDGINMLIQRKAQNNRNIFEKTSNSVLNGLSFQMLPKKLRSGRTLKHHIYIVLRIPYLNKQKDIVRLVLFRNGVT